MVVAEDTVLFIYKEGESPVFDPFPMTYFTKLTLAENHASICTLEVTPEAEAKLGRSHLILESQSVGLLMRFIIENSDVYDIGLDFADNVQIRIADNEINFSFK